MRKVILNSQENIRAGDPTRIYSQYVRYALYVFRDINFCTSDDAQGVSRKGVIHEHVIPHSIIMGRLLALDLLSNENIMAII